MKANKADYMSTYFNQKNKRRKVVCFFKIYHFIEMLEQGPR